MNPIRKRKLLHVLSLIALLMVATLLVVYALRQNISLFFTPTQIAEGDYMPNKTIRVGGMVVKGSIQRNPNNLKIQFDITDYQHTIRLVYEGLLPDLFREGQGVVAMGRYDEALKQFSAHQILAKHDENYMPPEVKQALNVRKGV